MTRSLTCPGKRQPDGRAGLEGRRSKALSTSVAPAIAASLLLASACNRSVVDNGQTAGDANSISAAAAPVSAAVPTPKSGSSDYHCPAPLSWGALRQRGENPPIDPVKNRTSLDAAAVIHWNGRQIDLLTLRQYLEITATMTPTPEFFLEVDPASPCDQISRVVAMVSGVLDCSRLCTYEERRFDPARMRALDAPARSAEEALDRAGDNSLGETWLIGRWSSDNDCSQVIEFDNAGYYIDHRSDSVRTARIRWSLQGNMLFLGTHEAGTLQRLDQNSMIIVSPEGDTRKHWTRC